jgi:nascent polypeptide-associated complex subunit alpha
LVKLRSVIPSVEYILQNLTHNQIEDMNSSAQLSAAQHLASSGAGVSALAEKPAGGDNEDDDDIPELEAAVEDEGPIDETGVDAKDIDLVMQQVGCSRAKAVRVLKESSGDLINASRCQPQPCLVKVH